MAFHRISATRRILRGHTKDFPASLLAGSAIQSHKRAPFLHIFCVIEPLARKLEPNVAWSVF